MKRTITQILFSAAICIFMLPSVLNAQKWVNPLLIPDLYNPNPNLDGVFDTIQIQIDQLEHNFNPFGAGSRAFLNTPVATYAYNKLGETSNTILGPSLFWNYKHKLHINVKNNLPHPATTHWHGAHVPTWTDGGPHQIIQEDSTWRIDFDILDKSATMWYHPHVMDFTYEQVSLGLSGMMYVSDPENGDASFDDAILSRIHQFLPTEYGENDIPLIIQSKQFIQDSATLNYEIDADFKTKIPQNPPQLMVNGRLAPTLEVAANMIRFRVLDGDSRFSFNLGFSKSENMIKENLIPFQLIATDAGYTSITHEKETILISPGERMEWLIDLRGRAGDTLYLAHIQTEMRPHIASLGSAKFNNDTTLMQIIVKQNDLPFSPIIAFPVDLYPQEIDKPDENDITNERVKFFTKDTTGGSTRFLIDNTPMRLQHVNDTVKLDAIEKWTLVNQTDFAHPWHIHDIHFYVTSILDTCTGEFLDEALYPEIFDGPKDVVLVENCWELSYITKFDDFGTTTAAFDSSYMFHCHILPHEDRGMMGQFVVVNDQFTNVDENGNPVPQMTLYPNPAHDQLTLEGGSRAESKIRIFDMQGKLLRRKMMPPFEGNVNFRVDDLARGMYFVEWITEESRFVNKVVLE